MSTLEDMAREAGFQLNANGELGEDGYFSCDDELRKFAALVRADERAKALDEAHQALQEIRDGGTYFGEADDHLHVAQKAILALKDRT